uniref:Uncharacterized protein n=1 Tax=Oryzias melastigma TaxID=30732 RepID=A0A3B3CH58_ORYME
MKNIHVLTAADFNPTTRGHNPVPPLSVPQKLYKLLSEVKAEVETVIKTGRQIVQKQQTEQPKELDDRVTALKLLYNQLGAQVGVLKLTSCSALVCSGTFWFLFLFHSIG